MQRRVDALQSRPLLVTLRNLVRRWTSRVVTEVAG